jgi:two-component system sensor histidine kinase/response regulator
MPMRYQDRDAVLGWFFDISERIAAQNKLTEQLKLQQRVEDNLRRANEEQQAIFDSVSAGIALIKQGTVQRFNRQLGAIFGFLPNELKGQTIDRWFAEDEHSQNRLQHLVNEIKLGRIKRQECQLHRKNGQLFWARLAGQALNRQNIHDGVVLIIEDINVERAATEEIIKAKNLAEEATRVKSDFLANMSHEIRTPMNAIIGFTHLLMRTQLVPRQTDYLKKIHTSSQHLMGIINDILDFSKIEAGKMVVENIEFDLEDLLTNLSALINEKATEKGLELVFDIAADVPMTLQGDPLRLGQVLINFASNAVKFTDRGEITIGIQALEITEHNTLLKFLVKDTGIGLSEEQMGRLFQSFQQADSSVTRKYGGTGLGLVICKNLAQIMGGEIGVNSQLGQGSEFWFTARLGKSQLHHRRHLAPHPDLRGKHMLVIDDNENARTVVSTLLQSMSFMVEEAISGPSALESIKRAVSEGKPFDAIFIDWQMPYMDGIEVAKNIRGMGLTPSPKLLLVTAYGREQVIKGAMQAGFDEIILKPVNASSLYDCVARTFGKDTEIESSPPDTQDYVVSDLADLAGARILLVEDNEMNQQIASELLQDAGFFVDIAVNGQEGVDKVKQNLYQLVLMDMQMPVMDGLTATQEIRKLPHLASLPIIAMTANAMTQDRERCLAVGMNDHLPKPLEPDDLWTALRKWIKPGLVSGPVRTTVVIDDPGTDLPTPSSLLSDVAGLNIQAALRRVQGKQPLYIKMLQQFVDKQISTPSDIQNALQDGDWQTAERLAHTLKSLAGNIGAESLQESAEELELALRIQQSPPEIEQVLGNTSQLLDTLITQLNGKLTLPNQPALSPVTSENDTVLTDMLLKLYDLLSDSDPEALNYFALHGHLLQTSHPEPFAEIKQAIESFQFEIALNQVAQLRYSL